jgi:hypothetical protein
VENTVRGLNNGGFVAAQANLHIFARLLPQFAMKSPELRHFPVCDLSA